MIPVYTPGAIREMDIASSRDLSIPGCLLMENAAVGMAGILLELLTAAGSRGVVVVVCGRGNNGGDGYAVARHLVNAGVQVRCVSLFPIDALSPDARLNYSILTAYTTRFGNTSLSLSSGIPGIHQASPGAVMFVDAVLGSGASGAPNGICAEAIRLINALSPYTVSLDAPSGIDCHNGTAPGDVVNAEITITAGGLKSGLLVNDAPRFCGALRVVSIGTNESALLHNKAIAGIPQTEDVAAMLPPKSRTANKYSAGRLLIIAGSVQYPGAAVLAARAAFKSGAGAVIAAVPESIRMDGQQGSVSELVTLPYKGVSFNTATLALLQAEIQKADALLVGPGLGRDEDTREAVRELLSTIGDKPAVLDADALFAVSGGAYSGFNFQNKVITPHTGEFSTLTGVPLGQTAEHIYEAGSDFCKATGAVLVLKGAPTVVFSPDGSIFINPTGNPGLAKFGSGDALAGITAALVAQGANSQNAAVASVYLHGMAADLLAEKHSEYAFTASDVISRLPEVFGSVVKTSKGGRG